MKSYSTYLPRSGIYPIPSPALATFPALWVAGPRVSSHPGRGSIITAFCTGRSLSVWVPEEWEGAYKTTRELVCGLLYAECLHMEYL